VEASAGLATATSTADDGAMGTSFGYLFAMALILAAVFIAYELGRSAEPPVCPACSHCRDHRLEREQRIREMHAKEDRLTTALQRLALPSHDQVAVTPVRRHASRAPRRGSGASVLHKILVGYDGGTAARRALDMAVELATGLGAKLAVISVVPLDYGPVPIDPCDDREVHAQELLEAREIAARNGLEVELVEPVGDPAQSIERVAEIGGFDAVLVGSGDSHGLVRYLRGSVSKRLAAHCARTVIIVH